MRQVRQSPCPGRAGPARSNPLIPPRGASHGGQAYLNSDDRPDAWDPPEEGYYDSRWTIPLASFFEPRDVRLIDVDYGGSRWQEVRLSAEKDSALKLFERHRPLLMSIIGRRLSDDAVVRFISTLRGRPGRYLLMNPDEVLGGINCGFVGTIEGKTCRAHRPDPGGPRGRIVHSRGGSRRDGAVRKGPVPRSGSVRVPDPRLHLLVGPPYGEEPPARYRIALK